MRFCPKCGKKGIKGDICPECLPQEVEYREISVKQCPVCKKTFTKGMWTNKEIQNLIIQKLEKQIKFDSIEFTETPKGYDVNIDDKYTLPILLAKEQCPSCSRLKSKYFEGILQLRNPNPEVTGYIKNFIKKNSDKVSITNEEKVPGGVDYFITDTNMIKTLAKNLNSHFGGYIKINYRIHTRDRQTSKEVFRTQVLFRMLNYKKNDIIVSDDNIMLITNTGEKTTALNVKNLKKESIEPKDFEVLEKTRTKISKLTPDIEVLDPETYQSIEVENPNFKEVKNGENVEVVKYKGKVYLVG